MKTRKPIDVLPKEEAKNIIGSQFNGEFGVMKHDGALLTVAQIASRKSYPFSPVVIDCGNRNYDKFKEFMALVKSAAPPCRERFILTGEHWICGDLEIDKEGNLKVLFLDSLGTEMQEKGQPVVLDNNYVEYSDLVAYIKKEFQHNITCYFSSEIRQHDNDGCHVFALDDARHLYTVEQKKYLPEKYKESGLFGYLDDHANGIYANNPMLTEQVRTVEIKLCDLPLGFDRSMQTRRLFDVIKNRSSEEVNTIIDKKGRKAQEIAEADFKKTPDSVGYRILLMSFEKDKSPTHEMLQDISMKNGKVPIVFVHEQTLSVFGNTNGKKWGITKLEPGEALMKDITDLLKLVNPISRMNNSFRQKICESITSKNGHTHLTNFRLANKLNKLCEHNKKFVSEAKEDINVKPFTLEGAKFRLSRQQSNEKVTDTQNETKTSSQSSTTLTMTNLKIRPSSSLPPVPTTTKSPSTLPPLPTTTKKPSTLPPLPTQPTMQSMRKK